MRRRIVLGGGVAAVAALAGAVAVLGGDDDPGAPAAARAAVGDTAAVERRDLVDRDEVDGTLGYASTGTLAAGATGTLTALHDPGAVIRRGEPLYDVDDAPAAFLFYGALPAWRDFTPWMEDGDDIRQLERNLRKLGFDPDRDMTVDDEWDAGTTAAVERFQDEHGLDQDGSLERGQVVFRSGPTRIGEAKATVGDPVSPGKPLAVVSSTQRRVTVDLEATRQRLAREGDKVTVELPTGRSARGRILDVGEVAELTGSEEEGAEPTIEVTITLRGKAARGTGLDQAPVEVGFAVERADDVLAVPVKALLARQGGGFAVEVVEGGASRIIDVEPGLYADDFVAVEGDLDEGETVVTAR